MSVSKMGMECNMTNVEGVLMKVLHCKILRSFYRNPKKMGV